MIGAAGHYTTQVIETRTEERIVEVKAYLSPDSVAFIRVHVRSTRTDDEPWPEPAASLVDQTIDSLTQHEWTITVKAMEKGFAEYRKRFP